MFKCSSCEYFYFYLNDSDWLVSQDKSDAWEKVADSLESLVLEPSQLVHQIKEIRKELAELASKLAGQNSEMQELTRQLAEERKAREELERHLAEAQEKMAIEVFYSYAHEDEELREELDKHLTMLKRQGVITGWHDREISVGTEWAGKIDEHLNSARVILLLISADFLASDYCYDVELKRAMERHKVGEARVIPVILRSVDWQGAPFGKLQALPKDAKPVTSWDNRDEAFTDIAQGIRNIVPGNACRAR
jgi:hypothetical protein